jgi:hypothetical protein
LALNCVGGKSSTQLIRYLRYGENHEISAPIHIKSLGVTINANCFNILATYAVKNDLVFIARKRFLQTSFCGMGWGRDEGNLLWGVDPAQTLYFISSSEKGTMVTYGGMSRKPITVPTVCDLHFVLILLDVQICIFSKHSLLLDKKSNLLPLERIYIQRYSIKRVLDDQMERI